MIAEIDWESARRYYWECRSLKATAEKFGVKYSTILDKAHKDRWRKSPLIKPKPRKLLSCPVLPAILKMVRVMQSRIYEANGRIAKLEERLAAAESAISGKNL